MAASLSSSLHQEKGKRVAWLSTNLSSRRPALEELLPQIIPFAVEGGFQLAKGFGATGTAVLFVAAVVLGVLIGSLALFLL